MPITVLGGLAYRTTCNRGNCVKDELMLHSKDTCFSLFFQVMSIKVSAY